MRKDFTQQQQQHVNHKVWSSKTTEPAAIALRRQRQEKDSCTIWFTAHVDRLITQIPNDRFAQRQKVNSEDHMVKKQHRRLLRQEEKKEKESKFMIICFNSIQIYLLTHLMFEEMVDEIHSKYHKRYHARSLWQKRVTYSNYTKEDKHN